MLFTGLGKVKIIVFLAAAIFLILGSLWVAVVANDSETRTRSLGLALFFTTAVPAAVIALRRLNSVPQDDPGLLDPLATVVLSRTKLNSLLRLIFALGAVAASATFITTSGPGSLDWVVGWIMLVVFGIMGFVSLMLLFWRGYTITLSPVGVDYSPFKVGPIEWSDIRSAELRPYMKRDVLNLELVDNEKYFARGYSMRKMNEAIAKRVGLSPFIVSGEAVGHTSRKVQEAVAVRLAAFGTCHST